MANEITPIDSFRRDIDTQSPQIFAALPKHVSLEKFKRVLMTAVSSNPEIVRASRATLWKAVMDAAKDGLLPDNKEAAMILFKDQVKYMPMVAGIMKLVRNSGELASITAQTVHTRDFFEYWVDDTGEHLTHKPLLFETRGDMIGVYALAKTKDGAVYIEVLTKEQVEKIKNVSRAGGSGPWGNWYEEMAKKSAIRRLSKRLPMSTDFQTAIERDDETYEIDQPKKSDDKPAQAQANDKPRSRLAAIIVDENEVKTNAEEVPL